MYKRYKVSRKGIGGQPKKVYMIKGIEITTNHPLYSVRYGMMSRCYNAKSKPSDFKHYQSKGIKVCEDWITNPISFYEWAIDNGWKKGLCIDRIDPSKDYEPNNCQFLTLAENNLRVPPRKGTLHWKASTTEEQVLKIKELLSLKRFTHPEIAKQSGVSRYVVADISKGKTWRHL